MNLAEKNAELTDIIIIGGGPTGLFAAFYAGIRHASVKVIESMPQLGGQLSALYPEKYIYDVAGFPKVTAQQLIDNLIDQASLFKPQYHLNEKVINITKHEECHFEINTTQNTYFTKSIIITAGCGAFEPRKIDLLNCEKYEKTNLHYFVNDQSKFVGKDVLIAGGGDSALDWALMLEPIAKSIKLIHRRNQFRAQEHSVEQLKNSNITVITPREINCFHGNSRIEGVTLSHQKELCETFAVDEVIVSFGFISSLGPIKEWGLNIEKGSIRVNSMMETNIAGIYSAGDIASYPGKVKLIATGFGEAPIAVNHAKLYIDPDARLQPAHSSNLKL
ncbi:NAD(P)/FAD-dependent oxidoreductase [Polycladospora coralii]|uniref:NAD(P)/FAD-dependent oxidoreductase n=1 Tax=Polycladospora coralii TaxID=2771432 RepID=UPI001CD0C335|nr:NAD(P)/FAD-dependent oxidoreductase [Polycladospora coralii]